MIRPLRARHRRMFVLLGIVVGALLIAALWARRPIPRMETLNVDPPGESAEVREPDAGPLSRSPGDGSR